MYPLKALDRCERLERVPILALLGSFTGAPVAPVERTQTSRAKREFPNNLLPNAAASPP